MTFNQSDNNCKDNETACTAQCKTSEFLDGVYCLTGIKQVSAIKSSAHIERYHNNKYRPCLPDDRNKAVFGKCIKEKENYKYSGKH